MELITVKELEALLGSSITVEIVKPKFNSRTGRAHIPSSGDLVERNLVVTGLSLNIPDPNESPQWMAEGFITEVRPIDGAEVAIFTKVPL